LIRTVFLLQPAYESGVPVSFRQEGNRRWIQNIDDGFVVPIDDRFFYILRDMELIARDYPLIYKDMLTRWVNDDMPCPSKGPFPILDCIARDYVVMLLSDHLRKDKEQHLDDDQWNKWNWDDVSYYLGYVLFPGWFEKRGKDILLCVFSSSCKAGEFYRATGNTLDQAVLYANATWSMAAKINSQHGSLEYAMDIIQEWIQVGKVTWEIVLSSSDDKLNYMY
jgi:hypothetical protein